MILYYQLNKFYAYGYVMFIFCQMFPKLLLTQFSFDDNYSNLQKNI